MRTSEEDDTTCIRKTVSHDGSVFSVSEIMDAMSTDAGEGVGGTSARRPRGANNKKTTKKKRAKMAALNVVQGKNAVFRLLNTLFHATNIDKFQESEFKMTRPEMDQGAKGAQRGCWSDFHAKVMDSNFDVSTTFGSRDCLANIARYDLHVLSKTIIWYLFTTRHQGWPCRERR